MVELRAQRDGSPAVVQQSLRELAQVPPQAGAAMSQAEKEEKVADGIAQVQVVMVMVMVWALAPELVLVQAPWMQERVVQWMRAGELQSQFPLQFLQAPAREKAPADAPT